MSLVNKIPVLAIVLLLASCSPKTRPTETVKTTPPPKLEVPENISNSTIDPQIQDKTDLEPTAPIVVVALQRTACYGKCPVFELSIYNDGRVLYEGRNHVARYGKHEGRLPVESVDAIIYKAQSIGFFNMADSYPLHDTPIVEEVPTAITLVRRGAHTKRVTDHHHAPLALIDFEQYVESFLEKTHWLN